jgi:hypothetical protein
MVWLAIGTDFRTQLLLCPPIVMAMTYMEMLAEGRIFWQFEQRVAKRGWMWQQEAQSASGGTVHLCTAIGGNFINCIKHPTRSLFRARRVDGRGITTNREQIKLNETVLRI